MKPVRLRAQNYGPFRDLDVAFVDGATVVLGELLNAPEGADSNGAGKSHVLNGIPIALYGAPRGHTSLATYLTHGVESTELMLELEFLHLGETYRVRRGYSARGRGKSTLDFEVLTMTSAKDPEGQWDDAGEQWRPLTLSSAKETQQLIETTIGQTEEMFRRSGFLEQGARSFAHPDIKPAERKDLFAASLQLGLWQRLWDEVERPRKRKAEQDLAGIATTLAPAEERLAKKPDLDAYRVELDESLTDAKALALASRTLVETETARAAAIEKDEASWTVRNSAVRAAAARLETHTSMLRRTAEAQELLAAAREELREVGPAEDVSPLERQEAELVDEQIAYNAAVASRATIIAAGVERKGERDRLLELAQTNGLLVDVKRTRANAIDNAGDGTETCDHCGQQLGLEAAATAIAKLRAEADALVRDEVRLRFDASEISIPETPPEPVAPDEAVLRALRIRIASTRDYATRVATLQERIDGLERIIAETDTPEFREETKRLEREHAEALAALAEISEPEPGAAEQARANASHAEGAAAAAEKRAEDVAGELERTKLLLEQLDELQAQVAEAIIERDRLQRELDLLGHLDHVYGRDGVPAFVVDNIAAPLVELEANELLARVGMSYRIAIRSERVTQAGDIAGALDVLLLLPDGTERPYSRLSGGEGSRVMVALQHGVTQLLKRRRSADVEMFILDEPPYLDRAGQRAIAETLHELTADYPVVVVVSHDEELRDAFDQAIVVRKDHLTGIATVVA